MIRSQDGDSRGPRPAGPGAGEDTFTAQAAGKEPSPTPPAGGTPTNPAQGLGADFPPSGPGASGSPPSDSGASGPPPPGPGASGSPDAGPADEAVEKDIDALLAEAHKERDEYLDLAKRTQADFENFRKRMSAEVLASTARGKAEVLGGVIPVLDDLERAIQAAGLDPEGDSPDGLAHGVLLVFRSLRDALARNGVEAVDPTGERFDPQQHEALSTQPGDGAEPGTVVAVMQKGYRLGEQLVRPARVVVAE